MTFYDFSKNIFLLIVLAYIAPFFIEGITQYYSHMIEPKTLIGIITINDELSDSSLCIKHLHSFFKNPYIKGVLIKINCFNSSAGTSSLIFNELNYLKKEYPKPVITLIENICISGAYLIASSSDYIIAPETALIGGIGSYINQPELHALCQQHGIIYPKTTVKKLNLSTSEIKPTANDQQFIKHIATARKLSLATASNWADKKIFTGKQALSLGLINAVGSMHTVITVLKEKALIDSEIEWIEKNIHYDSTPFSISSLVSKVQYLKV